MRVYHEGGQSITWAVCLQLVVPQVLHHESVRRLLAVASEG